MDLPEAPTEYSATGTYRTSRKGVDVPSYVKKMAMDIPEYGIESSADGRRN